MKKEKLIYIIFGLIVFVFTFSIMAMDRNVNNDVSIATSASTLSNKKIGWGVKRNDNHEQPDLGSSNMKLLDAYEGIAMGNNEQKYVYLTFDEGYEAGYTSKLLDTLKENDVKAAFFITAHYLNTQPELVQRMIDEGHIVGNHF